MTLPKQAIKTFNEFAAKHLIILPLLIPAHYNLSTYSFDWNSIVLDGPFFDGTSLLIEHYQNDKPMFKIKWKPNDSTYFEVLFYKPTDKSDHKYVIKISASRAWLYDYTTSKNLYDYNVNSDGSLGSSR